jgi:CRISPR/Cas system-associated endoribonuclease Cas2
MNHSARIILSTLIAALVSSIATPGFANEAKDAEWQKNHPRREQVNHRLAKQHKRINEEVREGHLTKAQAAKLHKDDRQIRQEEHDMAAQNGGHITKLEQKALNQQENAVSRQIGK